MSASRTCRFTSAITRYGGYVSILPEHTRRLKDYGPVLESFLQTLQAHIAGFSDFSPRQQIAMTRMIWSTERRPHQTKQNESSYSERSLRDSFGRQGFAQMNGRLGIFEVSDYSKSQNQTRGYRLSPWVEKIKEAFLNSKTQTSRLLIQRGNKMTSLRQVPEPICYLHIGVTESAWENAKVLNACPVSLEHLEALQEDLILRLGFTPEVSDLHNMIGQVRHMADVDVLGKGNMMIRYAESTTGRLYAEGISLQNVPRILRHAALAGMYDYDFSNCHFQILASLSRQYGHKPEAIEHYLQTKRATRNGIAQRIGITLQQAKDALIALIYGANSHSVRPEDSIPSLMGVDRAKALYADPAFRALADDISKASRIVCRSMRPSNGGIRNAMGLYIHEGAKQSVILAHILQGIEARALRTVIQLRPKEPVLLMHDGWVSPECLTLKELGELESAVLKATGVPLKIEVSEIEYIPVSTIPRND
jgi:hypothetical protein